MRLLEKLLTRRVPADKNTRRRFIRSMGILSGLGLVPTVARRAHASDELASSAQGLEPFIGEIAMFAGNFAPRNWAFCDGQLLPIAQYQALFSLLGTTYGGDGQTTFALPDLRGRFPLHPGSGSGLTPRSLGETGGAEAVALTIASMPSHTHAANASTGEGAFDTPQDAVHGRPASGIPQYATGPNTAMAGDAIGTTGGDRTHNNMPPYLGINFIIALQGVFPSRN